MAINAVWSPFYSWLLGLAMVALKPLAVLGIPVAHLVNFAVYLFALGCFHFFLLEVIRYQRSVGSSGNRYATLPTWAWLMLGYALYIWSSLHVISLSSVTPGHVCCGVYVFSCSFTTSHPQGSSTWPTFVFFGLVLGFAYLAKGAMFPLAFIFLGLSVFSVGDFQRAGRGYWSHYSSSLRAGPIHRCALDSERSRDI